MSDQRNKIAISFEISHQGVKLKVTGLYQKCYKENIYRICAIKIIMINTEVVLNRKLLIN